MWKNVFNFLSFEGLPSRDFVTYSSLVLFVANVISLIASIAAIAAKWNWGIAPGALALWGFSEGLLLTAATAFLVVLIKWNVFLRKAQKEVVKKYSQRASDIAEILEKTDQTMFAFGVAGTVAGLILSFFFPFTFLIMLAGTSFAVYSLFKNLKECEQKEYEVVHSMEENEKTPEKIFTCEWDTNVLILMIASLFGYWVLHCSECSQKIESFVEQRLRADS
ncbi:MAG: hypothetical protein DRP20_00455 [Thermotogae bacterium]|nr:MAG: hypothetical protein DRP20_00455 [Thermotogota bacterium]